MHSLEWTADRVVVDYEDVARPARIRAGHAIVAVPADIAVKIMPGLPLEYCTAFESIRYGRYVVVGFFTHEEGPQRWGRLPRRLHTGAVVPGRVQPRGGDAARQRSCPRRRSRLLCGRRRGRSLFELDDDEIVERFTVDLVGLYPELEGRLEPGILRRHPRVVPFWAPGSRASLATLREPLGPVHLPGDYQLDMPSLADAAASAQKAAHRVLSCISERPA